MESIKDQLKRLGFEATPEMSKRQLKKKIKELSHQVALTDIAPSTEKIGRRRCVRINDRVVRVRR